MDSSSPIVIGSDRSKVLRIGLLGLLMTACAAFDLVIGIERTIGVAGLVFFGIATLAIFGQAAIPMTLTVSNAGIALRSLRPWTMTWDEVSGVRLVTSGSSSSVAVGYKPHARPHLPFGRRRAGRHIPNLLAESPERVCEILAEALARARGPADPGAPVLPRPAPEAIEPPGRTVPWVSIALAIDLSLIFVAEIRFPVSPATGGGAPSHLTLVAFGASSRALTIGDGQWFRVVMAPLLHLNASHLILNLLALLWAGWLLERSVGRVWFAAVYAAGGLAGEVASLCVNPPDTIGVGASGAIMALFAAVYAVSFHYRGSPWKNRMQSRAVGILAPTLIHVGNGGGIQVNVAAHVGGAVAGVAIGLVLLRQWPRDARYPRHRGFAAALAGFGAVTVLAAVGPTAHEYWELMALDRAERFLIAGDRDQASREIADVLADRPDDGEAWNLKGQIEFAEGDPRGAAEAFGTAYQIRRDPADLGLRGLAAFYAGDTAAAMSDLREAAATGGGLYPAIWLDMIRLREGMEAKLTPGRLADAGSDWPEQVAEMFAGMMTPEALHAIAKRTPRTAADDRLCEADVYVAEWDLAHARRDAARAGFRQAVGECPPGFGETFIAREELARAETAP